LNWSGGENDIQTLHTFFCDSHLSVSKPLVQCYELLSLVGRFEGVQLLTETGHQLFCSTYITAPYCHTCLRQLHATVATTVTTFTCMHLSQAVMYISFVVVRKWTSSKRPASGNSLQCCTSGLLTIIEESMQCLDIIFQSALIQDPAFIKPISGWPMESLMVTWPMTSRDPERSRPWPKCLGLSISETAGDKTLGSNGPPIWNGIWRIKREWVSKWVSSFLTAHQHN